MWVKAYTTNDSQCFIGKHTSDGNNIFLFGYWDGGNDLFVNGGEYVDIGPKTTEYQHLVAVVKKLSSTQSEISLYKNNTLLWTKTVNGVMGNTQGKGWVLGQDWDGTNFSDLLNGELDEVAIYNHALSQQEVSNIYTNGVKVSTRKAITYSYDQGGNIKTKYEYDSTTGALTTPSKTYAYTYGDANWGDKLTNFDGKDISYDSIGNPLSYNGWTYNWEEGRQLKGIIGNGYTISFQYNDSGIRTQKTVNGVTTNYHLVGDKVTYEDNGTDKIYYTYDSSDNLVSMNLNGVEYFYIRNVQGDIIGLFDKNGTQVVSYVYDSWGKLISTTGTLASTVGGKNPYRYRGATRS